MSARPRYEVHRALLLGELRLLHRCRWGPILPEDDAGLDCIEETLILISLAPGHDETVLRRMRNQADTVAPWLGKADADDMIREIGEMSPAERQSLMRRIDVSERNRVTQADRERIGLRYIPPCDISREEMIECSKSRRRKRDRERKRKRYKRTRAEHLASFANSEQKLKPWEAEGISRRTWYRRQKAGTGSVAPGKSTHQRVEAY